jgi:methanogenic corrinoid protein MtbC1
VSESSLKRWCDAGLINAVKTAGGHRRLRPAEVVAFLKRREQELHDPTAIGLPDFGNLSVSDSADAQDQLVGCLTAGDENQCKRLLFYLYLNGWDIAELFDQVVAPAFEHLGEMWKAGRLEVYEERRASEICLDAMREFRSILVPPAEEALTALGGSIEHDHYALPTLAVELTLSSLGWYARSLGSNLPLDTLLKAAVNQQPDLIWISASFIQDNETFVPQINRFAAAMPAETTLVIGGSALDGDHRNQIKNAICCDNHSQLVACVRNLKRSRSSAGSDAPAASDDS